MTTVLGSTDLEHYSKTTEDKDKDKNLQRTREKILQGTVIN